MKNIIKQLAKHAHELGAIYYAWSILAGISLAAYGAYKQFSDVAWQDFFFYAFLIVGGLAIICVPVLLFMLVQRGVKPAPTVSNPTLKLLKRNVSYNISPIGFEKRQELTFEALEKTEHYQFSIGVTGASKATLSLKSPHATLAGPSIKMDRRHYRVCFNAPLQAGQEMTVTVVCKIEDPSSTMDPFVAESFTNCAAYGSFSAEYRFTQPPQVVHSEVVHSLTQDVVVNMQQLMSHGGKYKIDHKQVQPDASYVVSWIW